MFYFDQIVKKYEKSFSWDNVLTYLEERFLKESNVFVLNSLIGFSWYYLIEGPIDSGKYQNDENELALAIWKKYIDIGIQTACDNQYFNFIAGYTLSMNGFLINSEYESKGILFMKNCYEISDDLSLKLLADNFLKNEKCKKHVPLKNSKKICADIFSGDSLLERYFCTIYS